MNYSRENLKAIFYLFYLVERLYHVVGVGALLGIVMLTTLPQEQNQYFEKQQDQ